MGAKGIPPYAIGDEDIDNILAQLDVTRKLNYFYVPVLAKYKFHDQFYAEAGPQIGLLAKANDVFQGSGLDDDEVAYVHKVTSDYNRIDFGVTFGLGYRLIKGQGMNFGARYYLGLTNILKDNPGDAQHNSALYLFVGIPIGAGKAKQNEE